MEIKEIQNELFKVQKIEKEGDSVNFICSKYQQIQVMSGEVFVWCNKVTIYKEIIAMYVNNYIVSTLEADKVSDVQVKEVGGK